MPRKSGPSPRGRGRPASSRLGPKTETVHVRILGSEKRALEQRAAAEGESPSRVHRRLIREYVTSEPDYFGSEIRALREGCDGLSRVGNNLNQLTKLAHQGAWQADDAVLSVLEEVLKAVESLHTTFAASVRRVVERRV